MVVSMLVAALVSAPVRDLRSRELLSSVAISGTCARGCRGRRVFGTGEIVARGSAGRLLVLTAKHVIDDMHDPHVFVRNGEPEGTRIASAVNAESGLAAEVVAKSPDTDLALISFRPERGDAYGIASFSDDGTFTSGDIVGGPYGALWTVSPYRAIDANDANDDATLVSCTTCGPGDSGGGVFDRRGALAGILIAQQVLVKNDEPIALAKRSTRFKIVALADVRAFVASVPREQSAPHDAPSDPWARFDRPVNARASGSRDAWSRFAAQREP